MRYKLNPDKRPIIIPHTEVNTLGMLKTAIFLWSLLLVSHISLGQKGTVYRIHGLVLDKNSKKPLSGTAVFTKSLGYGVACDKSGFFVLGAKDSDTLIIRRLGYGTSKIAVKSISSIWDTTVFYLKQEAEMLQEVIITDEKPFEPYYDVKQNKQFNTSADKYLSPGGFSLITYLYDVNSQKYKSYQKVKELVAKDEKKWYFTKRLNYKKLKAIIPIPSEDYDDFIEYCQYSKEFLTQSTDYELIVKLKDDYEGFVETKALKRLRRK
ncbi:MAG: carboxypeptidase-like regulatory domain-containing protein [Cytophagales bacterium]|nr:carboxypeptidase-like regulatory domain-containing protein [Cytophagales bacterium]